MHFDVLKEKRLLYNFDLKFEIMLDFLSNLWYCWCYQITGGNKNDIASIEKHVSECERKCA